MEKRFVLMLAFADPLVTALEAVVTPDTPVKLCPEAYVAPLYATEFSETVYTRPSATVAVPDPAIVCFEDASSPAKA